MATVKVSVCICILIISGSLAAQNVGIGVTDPLDLLHVKDGSIRLEGQGKYLSLYTSTPANTGLQFYKDSAFKGGWFYNSGTNLLNLTTSASQVVGWIYDLNNNKMFHRRNFSITPSETFGIRSPISGPAYGGMYVETFGNSGGKPFYGYAIDSLARAYHYYDGADNKWKLNVSGDRIFVTSSGLVGIGIANPATSLHVANTVRIDAVSPSLQLSTGTDVHSAMLFISPDLVLNNFENGGMNLLTNGASRIYITQNGRVGIGTTTPEEALHVEGRVKIGGTNGLLKISRLTAESVIDGTTGLNLRSLSPGKIQFYTLDTLRMAVNQTGQVSIGTGGPATGYALSVDGKIISEELKVQMSQQWPDYVFEEKYPLTDLRMLEEFIRANKRLPGIPSSQDVTATNGIELGEMNRVLVEKIEELTLYIIALQKQIDAIGKQ